jgi:hypothetical protein
LKNNQIKYEFTEYFEKEVLRKRPYLKKEWCIRIIKDPIKSEKQENNRYRFWGSVEELDGRIIRVVTLGDKKTIHNAFPDRRFKK